MLLSVTFCDGQVSGEAKYLVGDSSSKQCAVKTMYMHQEYVQRLFTPTLM